eukprot:TRINITY_DN3572_c0_g1_i5.p1 TRINITY_DN3572_c0_g1~~TRINITY_DN3572_c0_g1_i5.p1  ORF type:complete len:379 (+),score=81.45 TRINITY_DN3572_c0_g1_i5:272-1408(+)
MPFTHNTSGSSDWCDPRSPTVFLFLRIGNTDREDGTQPDAVTVPETAALLLDLKELNLFLQQPFVGLFQSKTSALAAVLGQYCLFTYRYAEGGNGEIAHQAVALLQFATDAGRDTMGDLAHAYEIGFGVQKDMQKAAALFQRAAEAGNVQAMIKSAFCLLDGEGVARDAEKARTLLQRAADAGSSGALFLLGHCYEYRFVPRDNERAVTFYQRASDAGDLQAMAQLGKCILNGNGVAKDPARAVSLLERAAGTGESGAMVTLGRCLAKGEGVPRDLFRAQALFQQAADEGNTDGLLGLAKLSWPRDKAHAVALIQQAADAGDVTAMHYVGEILHRDAHDLVRAVAWCKRSCVVQGGPVPGYLLEARIPKILWRNSTHE